MSITKVIHDYSQILIPYLTNHLPAMVEYLDSVYSQVKLTKPTYCKDYFHTYCEYTVVRIKYLVEFDDYYTRGVESLASEIHQLTDHNKIFFIRSFHPDTRVGHTFCVFYENLKFYIIESDLLQIEQRMFECSIYGVFELITEWNNKNGTILWAKCDFPTIESIATKAQIYKTTAGRDSSAKYLSLTM